MPITASAPGKLLLYGDHAVVYGHPCIVTAVDQRMYVTVAKNGADSFNLSAPDLGLRSYTKSMSDLGKKELPKAVSFMEMLYKRFLEKYPQKEGIEVTTKSDFSSQFGFGSSSAVTVAFAKALTTLYGVELDEHALFAMCYQAVLDVQGVGSGFDVASAIWGGTILYRTPAAEVRQLNLPELPIVVGYTGIKADTPTLIRMVELAHKEKPDLYDGYFATMGETTRQAEAALVAKDWQLAGRLMLTQQATLHRMQVSSVKLDDIIDAATNNGAFGAKLSGAGGGDCMVALTTKEKQTVVEAAITQAGGQVMHVQLQAPGVRLEINAV